MGAESENARANESQKLLNWGFTAFEPVKLFDANQTVFSAPIWKGTSRELRLGQTKPVVVAVPAGSAGKLSTQVLRPDPLVAPVSKGQPIGTLRIQSGDAVLANVPLLALESVDQAGILARAWDAIRIWIR
jgi:D-alanyl-D-alanine carboxypeptidase (penicillin-binding protein 5/6)